MKRCQVELALHLHGTDPPWRRRPERAPMSDASKTITLLRRSLRPSRGFVVSSTAVSSPLLPKRQVQGRRWLSSEATSSKQSSTSLRNMIKPFLLQCHPDLQAAPHAKDINLQAVQNLHSYLDQVESNKPRGGDVPKITEIDFVLTLPPPAGLIKPMAQPPTSRRKVELVLPSSTLPLAKQRKQAQKQLRRLLRVADLPVPQLEEDEQEDDASEASLDMTSRPEEPLSAYELSRQRFMDRLNPRKLKTLYQKLTADMEADLATYQPILPEAQRRDLVANILSRLRFDGEWSWTDQLATLRRLSLVLDDHADRLSLQDCGRLWEQTTVVLTAPPSREYSFTLHPNESVTMQIPRDFDDKRLIQELQRNVYDFERLVEVRLEDLILDDEEEDMGYGRSDRRRPITTEHDFYA